MYYYKNNLKGSVLRQLNFTQALRKSMLVIFYSRHIIRRKTPKSSLRYLKMFAKGVMNKIRE